MKTYYELNREDILPKTRAYYEKNKKKILDKQKIYWKEYYLIKREIILEKQAAKRQLNAPEPKIKAPKYKTNLSLEIIF